MPPNEKPYRPSHGNDEQIELVFTDGYNKTAINKWIEYSFTSDFMEPSDAWSFVVAGDNITEEQFQLMRCGSQVELSLNGEIQGTGYIDSITISASSNGGVEYRIQGRDNLAQAVDACANPTMQFKAGMTLHDVLKQLFTPFGWAQDEQFAVDNSANVDVRSQVASKYSKGKKTFGRPLKGYTVHQLKPHQGEGVFQFASRISQRFGLWIWCSADGTKLIVSKPNFDQPPIYKLFRNSSGTTNILDGTVAYNISEQPTHIIADSFGAGSEFGAGRYKTIMVNNSVTSDPGPVDLEANYKSARTIFGSTIPSKNILKCPRQRVLYIRDDEAKTQEELDKFVMREMAHHQHRALTVHYTVEGHGQNTPEGFAPWATDTIVEVNDEPARLDEQLYVMARTFHKSRSSGTKTDLHLIRKNTLVF